MLVANYTEFRTGLRKFLDHVEFNSQVFYVDLPKLRTIIGIENVPEYKARTALKTKEEKHEYRQKRKKFEEYFQRAHSGNKDTPYVLPLLEAFKYHKVFLETAEREDIYKRNYRGFIGFESLSGADVKPIAYFHRYKDKISSKPDYGERVVGINFPTKNSLDGGIEIADLISYISCQTLRNSHRLVDELKGISEGRIKQIKRARTSMRTHCKIELVDVTEKKLPKAKKANIR